MTTVLPLEQDLSPGGGGAVRSALAERGIEVVGARVPGPRDDLLGELGQLIAESDSAQRLVRSIRWKFQNNQRGVQIRLSNDARDADQAVELARRAERLGLLRRVQLRPPHLSASIQLAQDNLGTAREFFGGAWLEQLAAVIIGQTFGDQADRMLNVKVRFPDGSKAELDAVAVVDGSLLWIECRSSTTAAADGASRYGRLRPLLGVAPDRMILVVRDIEADHAADLSALHGIVVMAPTSLRAALGRLGAQPTVAQPALGDPESMPDTSNAPPEEVPAAIAEPRRLRLRGVLRKRTRVEP